MRNGEGGIINEGSKTNQYLFLIIFKKRLTNIKDLIFSMRRNINVWFTSGYLKHQPFFKCFF